MQYDTIQVHTSAEAGFPRNSCSRACWERWLSSLGSALWPGLEHVALGRWKTSRLVCAGLWLCDILSQSNLVQEITSPDVFRLRRCMSWVAIARCTQLSVVNCVVIWWTAAWSVSSEFGTPPLAWHVISRMRGLDKMAMAMLIYLGCPCILNFVSIWSSKPDSHDIALTNLVHSSLYQSCGLQLWGSIASTTRTSSYRKTLLGTGLQLPIWDVTRILAIPGSKSPLSLSHFIQKEL